LRLSSLEPGDVDDELLDVLASHDCCVPHLHLPLQSGSERILRQMNRQYGAVDYENMLARVSQRLDQPAISTDILVGFPGETEEDFQHTMAMARRAEFCKIHAFPFSPREGTAAARWRSEFVDGSETRRRMERLQAMGADLAYQFAQRFAGTIQRILVETGGGARNNDPDVLAGRSDRYFTVQFQRQGGSVRPGDVVWTRIDRVRPGRVVGTLVANPGADVPLQVLDGPLS
jgi:threonylcarbamoyladenosine tRNA methylthiotransferase MtaB